MTDKLSVKIEKNREQIRLILFVKICLEDGRETGLAFHGVPGGHEFTSFCAGTVQCGRTRTGSGPGSRRGDSGH